MKRKTVKSIVLTAVMVMALSMSACGSKEADAPADTSEVEETAGTEDENQAEPEAEPETEAEPEAESTGKYATVEEYYNDPEVKAYWDEQEEAAAGSGMSIKVEVSGNEFAIVYTYEEEMDFPEDSKAQLEDALAQNAAVFEAQAADFDKEIGQEGASTVVVRYLDAGENLLAEMSFKAQ